MEVVSTCEPHVSKPPWELVEFQGSAYPDEKTIKSMSVTYDASWNEIPHEALNEMKKRIEPLEKEHIWETLKKKTNPYELVYTQEGSDCPASISLIKPLSRSFFKMIEILQVSNFFERLPKGTQRIRSAHVAEGPGGFIEAFLERCIKFKIQATKIVAMTLKPTNNHIPGWRRTFNFLQKHPEVKIHYGADGTGDLYVKENQESYINLIDNQKVMLFTGDGGFDFSVDYENQEKSAYLLLIASSIIGLRVLAPTGMFVLKLFDIYSDSTHYLLRLITFCFKEWTLYKPATSRPCNSERYLICRNFRSAIPFVVQELQRLQEHVGIHGTFPKVGHFSFFDEKERKFLEKHANHFNETQLITLEKTIQLSTIPASEFSWKKHYAMASIWCNVFHIPMINWKAAAACQA
jgi:23S rRNA U2552 (ribose-2'-O)-methylase RlmE/FtsJ